MTSHTAPTGTKTKPELFLNNPGRYAALYLCVSILSIPYLAFITGLVFILPSQGFSGPTDSSLIFNSKLEVYRHLKNKTGVERFNNLSFDFNLDDKKDLLVGVNCVTAQPCLYNIFIAAEKSLQSKGTIFLNPARFEILKKSHMGMSDVLSYQTKGEKDGLLLRYRFDGNTYKLLASAVGSLKLAELIDP